MTARAFAIWLILTTGAYWLQPLFPQLRECAYVPCQVGGWE